MFYYAYLDANDIVVEIYGLPTQITHPSYILIPTNDRTLIGKRYNRVTGEFEEVVMFYYAVLGNKDIVVEVISSETEVTDPNKILIPSNDTTLIGKWYNRATGEFLVPPIHILAEHTTQQINIVNQDKWLQTELDEIKTKLTDLDRASFGGFKCRFNIEDNQETTSEWSTGSGKHYTFSFNTGLTGYFPKMVRIVDEYFGNATLVADLYIVRNADGSVNRAYLDKSYIGVSASDPAGTAPSRRMDYNINMGDNDAMIVGRDSSGNAYDEGGSAFFQGITVNNSYVGIGNFNYTENTLSFDMEISSNLIGRYTIMDLKGYVF